MSSAVALLGGYVLDLALGDPRWLPHPVVGFGRMIHWLDRGLNRGSARFWKGLAATAALVAFVFAATYALLRLASVVHPLLGLAVELAGVFFGLANRTLVEEGRAVFAALDEGLPEGRQRVARIVGRDTAQLSPQQVRTAVLETLSENLSDGVVAPLFWYAVLGLPGMMAYKMVNTLDSMIGHKDERYYWFGKAAARLDDAANYVPARITALLMVVGAPSLRGLRFVRRYGVAHDSPNAGYPEAALAGILDVRFGGPHCYDGVRVEKPWIGESPRTIERADLRTTVRINHTVCLLAVCAAGAGRAVLTSF